MYLNDQISEIAKNLNRTSAEVSAQCIPVLSNWQRDWTTRWSFGKTLETSSYITTSATYQAYNLSSTLDKILGMNIPGSNVVLQRMELDQLNALTPSTTGGVPAYFVPWGQNQVYLYPVPNASLDIHYSYLKKITDFTTASALSVQQSDIDTKYHDAGTWYGTWRLALRMGATDIATEAKKEYETVYALAQRDMVDRVVEPNQVRVAGEVGDSVIDTYNGKAKEMFWD